MARDPYAFLEECHARYGDLFVLRLPGVPPLHVCADPASVATLTARSYDACERFGGGAEYFVGPRALICLQGDAHRVMRRMVSPGLHADRLRACLKAMDEETERALAHLPTGVTVRMHEVFQSLTLRIILRCLFGHLPHQRSESLRRLVMDYLDGMFQPWLFALNMVLGSERLRAAIWRGSDGVMRLPAALQRWVGRVPLLAVAQRQQALYRALDEEIQRCRESPQGDGTSLLNDLVHAPVGGHGLTPDEVRDQLLMLLIGGHETTATTLAWTLHALTQNRTALDRLRQELTAPDVRNASVDALRTLPYLGAVIDESMRLFPIAPFVSRRLLSPLSVAGTELPTGSHVNPCIYLMQRRADRWTEPTRFLPERMLDRAPPVAQFFPFGSGPWRCIGAAFALYELRVVLGRLLQRFVPSAVPGVVVRPQLRWLTVAPSAGLPIRFHAA